MIVSLTQNEFVGSLTNLAIVTLVNKTVADTTTPLVQSCLFDAVDYGDKALMISVDTLEVGDYSATSSLLTTKAPTLDEQALSTTDKKKIQVTLNRYLMKGAFANEYSISEAFAVILSMLKKTKDIYLYKKCVSAYENYNGGLNNDGTVKPMLETQTVTIDLVDVTKLTDQGQIAAARQQNSNAIYRTLMGIFQGMTSPTRLYNELGFETLSSPDDIKAILNARFMNLMITDTLASLFNSSKISDQIKWRETIVIPEVQFTNKNTRQTVIGWIGDRNKYQIRPRFEVGTSFFDASTLNDNYWLHFWIISGFVNGYPLVKLVANFVDPTPAARVASK